MTFIKRSFHHSIIEKTMALSTVTDFPNRDTGLPNDRGDSLCDFSWTDDNQSQDVELLPTDFRSVPVTYDEKSLGGTWKEEETKNLPHLCSIINRTSRIPIAFVGISFQLLSEFTPGGRPDRKAHEKCMDENPLIPPSSLWKGAGDRLIIRTAHQAVIEHIPLQVQESV